MTAVQNPSAGASANISAVVRMLLAGRGDKYDVLIEPLGLGRTQVFERVRARQKWSAEDVLALAGYFGLPVTTFYDGPDSLFAKMANSQDLWPTPDDTTDTESYREALPPPLAVTAA